MPQVSRGSVITQPTSGMQGEPFLSGCSGAIGGRVWHWTSGRGTSLPRPDVGSKAAWKIAEGITIPQDREAVWILTRHPSANTAEPPVEHTPSVPPEHITLTLLVCAETHRCHHSSAGVHPFCITSRSSSKAEAWQAHRVEPELHGRPAAASRARRLHASPWQLMHPGW